MVLKPPEHGDCGRLQETRLSRMIQGVPKSIYRIWFDGVVRTVIWILFLRG